MATATARSPSVTRPRSLVAVGHPNSAIARLALLAIGKRREPSIVTPSSRSAARVFAVFGGCQRRAFPAARANDHLAASGATFAQRHLLGAFRRVDRKSVV